MVRFNRREKFLILTIALVATAWFCMQPLIKLGADQAYMTPPSSSHKLEAEELQNFLDLWKQMREGSLKEYLNQISLKASEKYPRPIVKWLEVNNWNAERFFYDEQHLRDILSCVELALSMETNINVSKEKKGPNLEDIIANQKEGLKACHFNQEEIDLVKNNREYIKSTFAQ